MGSLISSLNSKGYAHCRLFGNEIGFQNKAVSTASGAGRGLSRSFHFSFCHDRPLLVGKCVRFWALVALTKLFIYGLNYLFMA